MGLFSKGDKVTVTFSDPDENWGNAQGRSGTVEAIGPEGQVAVRGIDNDFIETHRGMRVYNADELRRG